MEPHRREFTYEDWQEQLSVEAYEVGEAPPYKPPPMFGFPEGWEPGMTYGYSEFGNHMEDQ